MKYSRCRVVASLPARAAHGRLLLCERHAAFAERKATLRGGRRPGVAMVVVLIALAVCTVIFTTVARRIALQQQSVELHLREMQAEWLADSGVQRAMARLAADANYRGETWKIPADEFGGRDRAAVTIRVEEAANRLGRRAIQVLADYPDDPYLRARRIRDLIVR